MKIKIVYNNEAREGFKSGWGFSCLVGDDVLFDTGCEGPGLLANMEKLKIDIKAIKHVVLSHHHWDHTGGLFDLLEQRCTGQSDKVGDPPVKVYALKTFSEHMKGEIQKRAELVEVGEPLEIRKGVFTTGLISGSTDEQSLIVETGKGIVVMAGCSHPGVDKILAEARKRGKIYALIGGLHGFSEMQLLKGIKMIGACHCTQKMADIKKAYPDEFKELKAGDVLEIS